MRQRALRARPVHRPRPPAWIAHRTRAGAATKADRADPTPRRDPRRLHDLAQETHGKQLLQDFFLGCTSTGLAILSTSLASASVWIWGALFQKQKRKEMGGGEDGRRGVAAEESG
ncbi:hypothetical protein HYPSUDRAFT_209977 [Hypholoma sublateritium FD-334 SS-4]|uniref:Uncharacterized protein n=1 Tax=Hypholoma sublateritium (strain FD-334 SS-4) TaxID=945553 RepID=A0A0D2LQ45_HYPSF|nr:hypothetical protein HYPSUDRAFT_209977 [Hypholoma sublateritium FD-334 SS-4]